MTILQYPGQKNYIAQWIVDHFPDGYQKMTYLEPFFGSGSVFFIKERSSIETINDIDSEIFNLFLQIRENPVELAEALKNTLWGRDEQDLAYDYTENPIERARRCIVRYWFTFGSNGNFKNGMRFEIKRNTGSLKYFHTKLPDVILQISKRVKHDQKNIVQIENKNVHELIPKYDRENVLMYLDPPYVLETRKNKKYYKHEFSNDDHENLLKLIICSKAKIIISGYNNDLYSKYLNNWHFDFIKTNDMVGNKKRECIWFNFENAQSNLFFEGESK